MPITFSYMKSLFNHSLIFAYANTVHGADDKYNTKITRFPSLCCIKRLRLPDTALNLGNFRPPSYLYMIVFS